MLLAEIIEIVISSTQKKIRNKYLLWEMKTTKDLYK